MACTSMMVAGSKIEARGNFRWQSAVTEAALFAHSQKIKMDDPGKYSIVCYSSKKCGLPAAAADTQKVAF